MKKVFLSAALALAVAGSWAFYPKAAEPPARMMVVGSMVINGYGAEATLSTISPTGEQADETLNAKLSSKKAGADVMLRLHAAELYSSRSGLRVENVKFTS